MDLGSFGEAVIWDLKRKLATAPVSVVLASRWARYESADPAVLRSKLRSTLDELNRIGVARVLVVLPYPEFKYPTLRCLLNGDPTLCKVPRAEVEARRRPALEAIHGALEGLDNVRAVDPVPVVCGAGDCPQVLDGMPVVFDDNHPTVAAASKVGAFYRADMDWLAGRM
jgi:hypothetical protein